MSALKPVSFKRGRMKAPRLSPVRVPGRHDDRFWTPAEIEIVRKYYPEGGASACLAHLPAHRTGSSVYQQARKLNLAGPRGRRKGEKFTPPDDFDARLIEEWSRLDGKKRGAVNELADRMGVQRWWLSRRARALHLVIPHKKEPAWTEAEKELLKSAPLHSPEMCVRFFREHGFNRTATAILVKAKRCALSRRGSRSTFSGTEAAKILGVDNKTVTQWCVMGELKAQRRGTRRLPQQGGDVWDIEPNDLRQFILDNLERIDLRKVEKFSFVSVLTAENGAAADAD